jgi:hypothetical protein
MKKNNTKTNKRVYKANIFVRFTKWLRWRFLSPIQRIMSANIDMDLGGKR